MVPDERSAGEVGLHQVSDELDEVWLRDWIDRGVTEVEGYLAKHAAFLRYLETNEP